MPLLPRLSKNGALGFALVGLILAGFSLPLTAASPNRPEAGIRDGLFLLKDTCQREVQLHFLPLLKTTPQSIGQYLKDLSTSADESIRTIDRLQSQDSSLQEEKNPLPLIEQATRKNFTDVGQQKILFGTKGPAYIRALLVDQLEETIYLASMAQVMANTDSDADRAKTLQKLATRWAELRDRGYHLLNQVR